MVKKCFHVKTEKLQRRGKGKRQSKRKKVGEEEELELKELPDYLR